MRNRILSASILAAAFGFSGVLAQQTPDTIEGHRAAAKVAAGSDHVGLLNTVCPAPRPADAAAAGRQGAARGAGAGGAAAGAPRPRRGRRLRASSGTPSR